MKSMEELENITYNRLGNVLIIIGIILAIASLFNITFIYNLWPVLTVILGIGFIGIFSVKKGRGLFYLAIGVYIICFSGLALFCNFTTWSVLSHLWPVFITFLGIVFFTLYFFRKRDRAFLFLSVILILLSLYFSIIFSYDYNAWWIIFIMTGLSILLTKSRNK